MGSIARCFGEAFVFMFPSLVCTWCVVTSLLVCGAVQKQGAVSAPAADQLCPLFLPRNGLPTDKPTVSEDVNIYQKYIAR